MFTLSDRSKSRLVGVEPKLIALTELAIEYTKIDFGVTCGMRTVAEQQELVDSGASQTMDSKHISGQAVDVVAYIGSRITWELNVYDNVADAFKIAAIETDTPIRWGAAWHIPDIRELGGTMEEAMNAYVDLRRRQGRRPFIDAPHFELG
jgi:peptidoglycan L-alanyl-D-glutamate endopeptidase CwlK